VAYLVSEPVTIDVLIAAVLSPERGAVATFLGTVRNHHLGRAVLELAYEAYAPMAEAECARIVAEAESRWPVRIALQHRIGRLQVGDVAVAIAAGSGHRAESFDACRYVIEELKSRVPIWKRERYADGSEAWVDPTAPGGTMPTTVRTTE